MTSSSRDQIQAILKNLEAHFVEWIDRTVDYAGAGFRLTA